MESRQYWGEINNPVYGYIYITDILRVYAEEQHQGKVETVSEKSLGTALRNEDLLLRIFD